MIILKINVTKIDKRHIFKGKKGKYLELVLMENPNGEDQYGNSHMVVQGIPKELRDQGQKGPILGNGKTIGEQRQQRPAPRQPAPKQADGWEDDDSDIPF